MHHSMRVNLHKIQHHTMQSLQQIKSVRMLSNTHVPFILSLGHWRNRSPTKRVQNHPSLTLDLMYFQIMMADS